MVLLYAFLAAYLAVGAFFAGRLLLRGALDFTKQPVTIAYPGGRRVDKESRNVAENLVALALALFGWLPLVGVRVYQRITNELGRREFERLHPPLDLD